MTEHIIKVKEALQNWLEVGNIHLEAAIEKTVAGGYFREDEIRFQLSVFRQNLEDGDLEYWTELNDLSDHHNAKGQKVLCLHAGNIPLVGLQDCLAALLSGADYYGKLSKKDPYLIASFLDSLVAENVKAWSTDIDEFAELKADTVLFAGSEQTVDSIKDELNLRNAVHEETKYVIRTAKLSIASAPEVTDELKDAMFMYEGKGCRSVGMIVSDFSLEEVRSEFEYQKMDHPKAQYLKAYYDSIGKAYLETSGHLIIESSDFPEEDFLIHWMTGRKENLLTLKEKYGNRIQSVYCDYGVGDFEKLGEAQRPPLYWKPDGVDVLSAVLN